LAGTKKLNFGGVNKGIYCFACFPRSWVSAVLHFPPSCTVKKPVLFQRGCFPTPEWG